MNQISERELREAIIATKKDAKLIAAARNDRTWSQETLYREFENLTVDRRREIIIAVSNDYFVSALWKIAFPLNNLPAAAVPDAVGAVGRALFFTREEGSVRETVRTIKLYQDSPFFKRICALLGDAAEIAGVKLAATSRILTEPEVFGILTSLDPAVPSSEKILETVVKVAAYTRNAQSTLDAARFLYSRRFSASLPDLARVVDESIFMARDRKSVRQILEGLSAGGIDVVLQRLGPNKAAVSAIRDVAWRSRNWRTIRDRLAAM